MNRSLSESQFLFLDCQTTGASPRLGTLLEVAYCKGNRDAIVASNSYLVDQPTPIPAKITDLTGITDDDLRNSSISQAVLCGRILSELRESSELAACVIHYAKFERPFLARLFLEHAALKDIPKPIICTHEIAKRLYPNLSSKGIRALHGYFGGHALNFKRAACHAEATHLIWSKMVADLSQVGVESFSQLIDWLCRTESFGAVLSANRKHHVEARERLSLPDRPGVYRMLNSRGDILYVGKAASLKSRVNSYFRGQTKKDLKTREMLLQTWNIEVTECLTALDAAVFESDEIKRLAPPYNICLKKGRRQILFYSRDFDSWATAEDKVHSIGPIAGDRVFEPLPLLCRGVQGNVFDERIFLAMVASDDIRRGLEIFRVRFGLFDNAKFTVRNLIAIGVKIARREKLSIRFDDKCDQAKDAALSKDVSTDGDDEEGEVDLKAEPTPEDFADAIEKLLRRAAINLSRAKALKLLGDSTITYREKQQSYILRVSGGEMGRSTVWKNELRSEGHGGEQTPWTVEKYDRLRVLFSELIRLRNRGGDLITTPSLRFFNG